MHEMLKDVASSEKLLTTHGIPQGSVHPRGSLLFLLCINDLHKAVTLTKKLVRFY